VTHPVALPVIAAEERRLVFEIRPAVFLLFNIFER